MYAEVELLGSCDVLGWRLRLEGIKSGSLRSPKVEAVLSVALGGEWLQNLIETAVTITEPQAEEATYNFTTLLEASICLFNNS